MSYNEGIVDAPYNTAESDAERAAHHQRNMDVLYLIGNQYNVRLDHMRELCDVACVSFDEFCKYSGRAS